jgi:SNF2 family DNA or RNA helicase
LRLNGILGDEMGVGKTIQTIALLLALQEINPRKMMHLIVGPKNVLLNWQREFGFWAPSLNVLVMPAFKEELK